MPHARHSIALGALRLRARRGVEIGFARIDEILEELEAASPH
jgi:hypothetical protein